MKDKGASREAPARPGSRDDLTLDTPSPRDARKRADSGGRSRQPSGAAGKGVVGKASASKRSFKARR
jgi:hypothetical protein